jgi:alpha-L-fucosidase
MITTASLLTAVTALRCMAADPMAPIDPAAFKAPVGVACIGDSITEGAGADKGKSWPEQLQGLLGKSWQVMNFGLGGRTLLKQGDCPYWKEKIYQDALKSNPDVVIIMLGTNDTKPQNWKHEAEFVADYREFVQSFQALASKPRIYVCRPCPAPVTKPGEGDINEAGVIELIKRIDALAAEMKLGVIDMHAALADKLQMLPDHVHPNNDGAGELAKAALAVLTGRQPAGQGPTVLPETLTPGVIVDTKTEPMAAGKFQPTWDSLKQYRTPEWFRDAKFGIWAHWGPQCQPEAGDWYARQIYEEGSKQYLSHLAHYGHPSKFGFKDVIRAWTADHWDPDRLVALYKRCGAQYFVAMANHHDNMDLWDSKYQPWNSKRIGPQQDLIAGWAKAAKANGLPFGVSLHAAHAWNWYEICRNADKQGSDQGIPYDGNLTKADGKGQWWDGLDPQDLYAQNHARSENSGSVISQWNWGDGACPPDQAYCDKFYNRAVDLINRYQPELIYMDDTALPLWPVSDAGLKIAAHFYNNNSARNHGDLRAVLFGKILSEEQRKAIVWDIEGRVPTTGYPFAWQTCACIGSWHYDRSLYDKDLYKSAKSVIQMLADIVSKNGNLLLSIPLRGDGSIDDKEEKILAGIAGWMDVNKEAIFGTRPWKIFGEGPATTAAPPPKEGEAKPFTAADVRFTTKGKTLYAMLLDNPGTREVLIPALATAAGQIITTVSRLGYTGKLEWRQDAAGLRVTMSKPQPADHVVVLKVL